VFLSINESADYPIKCVQLNPIDSGTNGGINQIDCLIHRWRKHLKSGQRHQVLMPKASSGVEIGEGYPPPQPTKRSGGAS